MTSSDAGLENVSVLGQKSLGHAIRHVGPLLLTCGPNVQRGNPFWVVRICRASPLAAGAETQRRFQALRERGLNQPGEMEDRFSELLATLLDT